MDDSVRSGSGAILGLNSACVKKHTEAPFFKDTPVFMDKFLQEWGRLGSTKIRKLIVLTVWVFSRMQRLYAELGTNGGLRSYAKVVN